MVTSGGELTDNALCDTETAMLGDGLPQCLASEGAEGGRRTLAVGILTEGVTPSSWPLQIHELP